MVGHVHEVFVGLFGVKLRRPLDGAGESRVLRRERSFPDVCELFQDVGHGVLVGVVVHEHDDAVVVENHLAERGPLVFVLRDVLGCVEVLRDAGVFYGWDEVFHVGEVGVADEHRDDFEGVLLQPTNDLLELGLEGAGVQEVAGRVAVVEGFVDVVDLALDCEDLSLASTDCRLRCGSWHTHADTIVELINDAKLLVACCVPGHGEGSIVGTHFGDVTVLPAAEFWVVITRRGVRDGRSAAGSRCGHCAIRVSNNLRQLIRVRGASDLRV